MAISVIAKFTQKNNGKFKLMDAKDVSYDGTEELSIKEKVDQINNKIIYFVLKDVVSGPQEYECPFMYNGKVKSISAIYKADTTEDIIIDIEKATSSDRLLGNWSSILLDKLTLNNSSQLQTYTIIDDVVNANDIFRINILNNNIEISSLTVNIEIIL